MQDWEDIVESAKKWFTKNSRVVLIGFGCLLGGLCLGFLGCYLWIKEEAQNVVTQRDMVEPERDDEDDEATRQVFLIDLRGAIEKPGVYEVEKGSIVDQLIELSGGLKSNADTDWTDQYLNYARELMDREKIYIPYKGAILQQEKTVVEVANIEGKVNINTASSSELEELPGVGPSTAKKIIEGRPYKRIEDIMNVKGIGEATFEKIKDKIKV